MHTCPTTAQASSGLIEQGQNLSVSCSPLALFDMPNLNRFDILSISIFCKIALSISISISIFSKITISISISISIFFRIALSISISISIFSTSPYRYRYRYRYFSKVSIYRQSIFHIDILTRRRSKKTFFTGVHGEGIIKCVLQGQKNAFFITFWINFMEYHSIQFTTISINVERGIVKILFKYRYFQDLLIDIDIDIDIFQNHHIDIDIDIDIFQNCLIDIDIDIDIFKNDHIDIDIDIDIFQKCRYIDNRYVISIYRTGLCQAQG